MEPLTCTRHPDTETYLRCSSCETPICPDCWVEAAVGYQCPACAEARGTAIPDTAAKGRGSAVPASAAPARDAGDRLPSGLAVRAGAVGLAAAAVGGMLLGPVFSQGTLFLLSSGAIGWGVARAVFWAAAETSTPFVRAAALGFAGLTAAVGLATSGSVGADAGMLFLAYPAAMYGGWIVVRRR